jgi:hypothetical protein
MDSCSLEAYDKIKAKGDQLSVLHVFRKAGRPLTAREAHFLCVKDDLKIDLAGVKSRITENTIDGLLEKVDKVTDPESGKKVNRWQPTKEARPAPRTDLFHE